MNNNKSGSATTVLMALASLVGVIGGCVYLYMNNPNTPRLIRPDQVFEKMKVVTPSGATEPIHGQLYQVQSVDAEAGMVIAMPGGKDPSVETNERRLLVVSEKIIKMGVDAWFIRDLSGTDYVVYPFGESGPAPKLFEEDGVETEPYQREKIWQERTL
jgi:hypothetical protein